MSPNFLHKDRDINGAVEGNGTDRTTGQHQGRFKNTAEGAGAGGFAGHEWEKHHGGTGPGTGTGAVAGGVVGNIFNRHHAGAGAGANGNVVDNGNGTNRATGAHEGRFANTAEGAGVGGVAGHEWEKHHGGTGPGAGTGAAVGGLAGNEYNRHHAGAGAGGGVGAGTGAGLGSAAGPASTNDPINREAKSLDRKGKIEKTIGTVLCSTTLQQHGLAKQAEAANMQAQHVNLTEAENLEAQAKYKRSQAVGYGAHPNNGVLGGQSGGIGAQSAGVGGGTSGRNGVY